MMTTFRTCWHDSRAEDHPTPDRHAPNEFHGVQVDVRSGDSLDDIEIVFGIDAVNRAYVSIGDLAEIQEVISAAIDHYHAKESE